MPYAKILTRHPTHRVIANKIRLPFPTVIRFGNQPPPIGIHVEVNRPFACENASDKLRMKQCFTEHGVKTAPWKTEAQFKMNPTFPIVAKNRFGSRGEGVYLLRTQWEYDQFVHCRERQNKWGEGIYIFEEFLDYPKEYRCHAWAKGMFYTCRKALKNDTPSGLRWKFNYNQTVWLKEENRHFDKPENWSEIEAECVKAVRACGLDFGGVDVKVRGKDFFIIEINSAPSFGDNTASRYRQILPLIAWRCLRLLRITIRLPFGLGRFFERDSR